jgi:hypothetical protein
MELDLRRFWIQAWKIIEDVPTPAPELLGNLWNYPLLAPEVKYFIGWIQGSSKALAPYTKIPFIEDKTKLPSVTLKSDSEEFRLLPVEIEPNAPHTPRGLYVFSGTSGYPSAGTLNKIRRITEYIRFEEDQPVTLEMARNELLRIGREAQAQGNTVSLFPFGARNGKNVYDPTPQEFAGEVLTVTHQDGRVETTIFGPLPDKPSWEQPIDASSALK